VANAVGKRVTLPYGSRLNLLCRFDANCTQIQDFVGFDLPYGDARFVDEEGPPPIYVQREVYVRHDALDAEATAFTGANYLLALTQLPIEFAGGAIRRFQVDVESGDGLTVAVQNAADPDPGRRQCRSRPGSGT
jgi:hypothetical protein